MLQNYTFVGGCIEFSATPPFRCTRCMPGYWLSSDPSTGSTTCVKVCAGIWSRSDRRHCGGLALDHATSPPALLQCAPVPGCAGWAGSAAKPEECVCAACQERFALAGAGCTPCSQAQCIRCPAANPAACRECAAGWSPFGGVCKRCTATACSSCEPDSVGGQRCTACGESFYLDDLEVPPACRPCNDTVSEARVCSCVQHPPNSAVATAPNMPLYSAPQNCAVCGWGGPRDCSECKPRQAVLLSAPAWCLVSANLLFSKIRRPMPACSHVQQDGRCVEHTTANPHCLRAFFDWAVGKYGEVCLRCAPGYTPGPARTCTPCAAPSAQVCAQYAEECACAVCHASRPPHCSLHTDAGPTPHCLATAATPPFACLACVPGAWLLAWHHACIQLGAVRAGAQHPPPMCTHAGYRLASDPAAGGTTCEKVHSRFVLTMPGSTLGVQRVLSRRTTHLCRPTPACCCSAPWRQTVPALRLAPRANAPAAAACAALSWQPAARAWLALGSAACAAQLPTQPSAQSASRAGRRLAGCARGARALAAKLVSQRGRTSRRAWQRVAATATSSMPAPGPAPPAPCR